MDQGYDLTMAAHKTSVIYWTVAESLRKSPVVPTISRVNGQTVNRREFGGPNKTVKKEQLS